MLGRDIFQKRFPPQHSVRAPLPSKGCRPLPAAFPVQVALGIRRASKGRGVGDTPFHGKVPPRKECPYASMFFRRASVSPVSIVSRADRMPCPASRPSGALSAGGRFRFMRRHRTPWKRSSPRMYNAGLCMGTGTLHSLSRMGCGKGREPPPEGPFFKEYHA